jgi:hypothetical protein
VEVVESSAEGEGCTTTTGLRASKAAITVGAEAEAEGPAEDRNGGLCWSLGDLTNDYSVAVEGETRVAALHAAHEVRARRRLRGRSKTDAVDVCASLQRRKTDETVRSAVHALFETI